MGTSITMSDEMIRSLSAVLRVRPLSNEVSDSGVFALLEQERVARSLIHRAARDRFIRRDFATFEGEAVL